MKSVIARKLGIVLAAMLMPAVAGSAQQTKKGTPDPAPVPEQIGKAKRVFVSNAGADVVGTVFSGGDDRPYNQFYAEMKNWGRYQLMPSPAGSDLIFEVVFVNQVVGFDVNNGTSGVAVTDAHLRLAILDPATHVALWAFNKHMNQARTQAARDKNFDEAMAGIVAGVKELAARPAAGN